MLDSVTCGTTWYTQISLILETKTWKVAEEMLLALLKKREREVKKWTHTHIHLDIKGTVTIDSLHQTCGNLGSSSFREGQYHTNSLWPRKITSWSLDTVTFSETCSGCGFVSSSTASFCCSISNSFRRAFLRLVSAPMMGRLGGGGSGSSIALGFLFCIGQFRFPLWHAQSTL